MLGKTIDHIFLDSNADKLILEYATRSLENYLPQYKWELSITNQIEAKLYTKSKKIFYKSELPNLRKKLKKKLYQLIKAYKTHLLIFIKIMLQTICYVRTSLEIVFFIGDYQQNHFILVILKPKLDLEKIN